MNTHVATKKAKPKVDNFKIWLESKPYWEKYLWQLHMTKDILDDEDIKKCYQYLLEDYGVVKEASGRLDVVFPALDLNGTDTPKAKTTLDKIENLKDVNAIDDSCVLEFGKNLTIIYGDNGAGKSGIGRLLSNACLSRKPRKLLPNARKASYPATMASADFHLSDASGSSIINYTLGQTHEALKSFAVFDHECALIHLNSENKVEFVPSKIKIFDEVFKSIINIEAKLQTELESKQQDNPAEGFFTGTSAVTEFLNSLSYNTTDDQIDGSLKLTPSDKNLLADKNKLVAKKLKQDVAKQKKELTDECNDLGTYKNTLGGKSLSLSKIKADAINALIKEIKDKKEIADKLSVNSFDFASFKNIGSSEWKSLILAAQKLYEKETFSNNGVQPEHCVLCRQALTETEKTLFSNYWDFLKSTAETELAQAKQKLKTSIEDLQRINTTWPAFSETEVAVKILKKDISTDLEKIKKGFEDLNILLLDWIEKVGKEQNINYSDPKIDLKPIDDLIEKKKKTEASLVDPTPEINTLNREISYLEQKQQASGLLSKIKKYVAWLRWKNAITPINLPTVRGNTTRKKTEIMGELVISQYVDIFNIETEELDCNFGLKVESHGRDATTVKELKLEFARGYDPSDILSEGEQTVSALADFLTESKLDKNNSGIVFDDPVTSLDHERRSTIAKRLVKEAKERQVIVLTHDIVFLLDLQFYADSESVDNIAVSMRKNGDKVGLVKPELPWIALDVKKKVGYLKNELPVLKKAESGDQDDYRNKVKLWYMLLREAWERAVEERLFKGVVQRFNRSIQTQRLDSVDINPTLIKEVNDGMSESSKWLHDMAVGTNPAVPKNVKLEAELMSLENFITKCKPN